jgi:Fe(3+) dicitrate transport protein
MNTRFATAWIAVSLSLPAQLAANQPAQQAVDEASAATPDAVVENVSVFGLALDARDVAGGASTIDAAELEEFESTDVIRALRRVPGASFQLEDGFGLRPNISIRGTPTERSSRITLLEDNVLIAPAPYAAPAAYYFPTFGRIDAIEVLKGPAAITQGPYTIGGALNLVSTPIPHERGGFFQAEAASDNTRRLHGWYGDASGRAGWMVETHQWQSDGYQHIDRHASNTGLDKQDYLAKLAFSSDPAADVYQQFLLKVQASEEDSNQTYLGLADADFEQDPLRRYGLSALDNMHNEHQQVMGRWSIETGRNSSLALTAYLNTFERAWYKTEGIDFDGSGNAESFDRTGWASVIDAINHERGLAGLSASQLRAILEGEDTARGAIQLRNNSRSYESSGLQLAYSQAFERAGARHELQLGLRYHEDEEDRLQRNDTWQQRDGLLVLSDRGREGNAGNRIQRAKAWAAFIQDRIETDRWVITPGLRFESIEQSRIDFGADPADLSGREAADIRRVRRNHENVLIPGIGAIFELTGNTRLVAGVHRGFSAPGNREGIEPETSINYEAGFRHENGPLELEVIAFFNDYDNLQGVCTASSGSDCEIGDVFNGDAVKVPGVEFQLRNDLSRWAGYRLPLLFSYTWMNAKFESDIADSEYFGDVRRGDAVPYVPDHQAFLSLGLEKGAWSAYISANYADSVCTLASCGAFETTEASTVFDLGLHYRISPSLEIYSVLENLTAQLDIVSRQPYGARPSKDRTWAVGARLEF